MRFIEIHALRVTLEIVRTKTRYIACFQQGNEKHSSGNYGRSKHEGHGDDVHCAPTLIAFESHGRHLVIITSASPSRRRTSTPTSCSCWRKCKSTRPAPNCRLSIRI